MLSLTFSPANEAAIAALSARSDGLALVRDMHRRHFLRELGPVRLPTEHRSRAPDVLAAVDQALGALPPLTRRHLRARPPYLVECYAGHLAIHLPGQVPDALAARIEAAMHEYLQARSLCRGVWESARTRPLLSIRPNRLVARYRIDRFGIAMDAKEWDAACEPAGLEEAISAVVYAGIINACLWEGWRPVEVPRASDLGIEVVGYLAESDPRPHDEGTCKRIIKRASVEAFADVGGILACGVGIERGFGLLYKESWGTIPPRDPPAKETYSCSPN